MSPLASLPLLLFPNASRKKALIRSIIHFLLIGSVLFGIVSYAIGEREYYRADGRRAYGNELDDDSLRIEVERDAGHFFLGMFSGALLLVPFLLALSLRIRREFLDHRIPGNWHPSSVFYWVNITVTLGILMATVHSYWAYPWRGTGFGQVLFITSFFYPAFIFPSGGIIGFFFIFYEDNELIPFFIISIIGTYALIGSLVYDYWFKRKEQERQVREFIEHCPFGSEIPISEMAWILMQKPVMVRTHALKLLKKGMSDIRIDNWNIILERDQNTEVMRSGATPIIFSNSLEIGNRSGYEIFKLHEQLATSSLSGKADLCSRCGNSLQGRDHCSLCGYRNLNSLHDHHSPTFPPLTSWISNLRGGVDPLQNALLVMIATGILLALISGGLTGLVIYLSGRHISTFHFEILMGFAGGGALAPFMVIPQYLKIRTELIEQRVLPPKEPIRMVIFTNFVVGFLVMVGALGWAMLEDGSEGPGVVVFLTVVIFYLSIVSGGIAALAFFLDAISYDQGMAWSSTFILIATFIFYAGMAFSSHRNSEILAHYGLKGIGKKKRGLVRKFLSCFVEGEAVPLHMIGRLFHWEPDRVRSLLMRMITRGEVLGQVSEFHLILEDVPNFRSLKESYD